MVVLIISDLSSQQYKVGISVATFTLGQFLKRPVWRKISMCKINFNSKIQKSKLKRNL